MTNRLSSEYLNPEVFLIDCNKFKLSQKGHTNLIQHRHFGLEKFVCKKLSTQPSVARINTAPKMQMLWPISFMWFQNSTLRV